VLGDDQLESSHDFRGELQQQLNDRRPCLRLPDRERDLLFCKRPLFIDKPFEQMLN
jgi:hypothetical protein